MSIDCFVHLGEPNFKTMSEKPKNNSKRSRSPSYPVCDLKTAIEKAEVFYSVEAFNEAIVDVAVQSWGLTPGGSAGYRLVAALLHFGLFEDEGSGNDRKVRLSELGKEIVIDERENSIDRINAIQRAALNPPIYSQLYEKWGDTLPSDANMKYYLIKELGFNSKHVDGFIKDYRSTIEFAEFKKSGLAHSGKEKESSSKPSNSKGLGDQEERQHIPKKEERENSDYLEIPIPLISGKRAILYLPIPLSDTDFNLVKNLITSYLESMKPAIVKRNSNSDEKEEEGGPTRSH